MCRKKWCKVRGRIRCNDFAVARIQRNFCKKMTSACFLCFSLWRSGLGYFQGCINPRVLKDLYPAHCDFDRRDKPGISRLVDGMCDGGFCKAVSGLAYFFYERWNSGCRLVFKMAKQMDKKIQWACKFATKRIFRSWRSWFIWWKYKKNN